MTDTLHLTTADGTDITLEVAGVGSRSYAFVADWHVRFLFVLVWIAAVMLVVGADDLEDLFDADASWTVYAILSPPLLVYFLYHPVLEILMRGRTPGKRLAGVRIVTTDGRTPGIGPLLVRNVLRLVDSLPSFYAIGLIVAIVTERHVRIGDLAAGTLLVHESKVSTDSLQTATRLALSHSLSTADQAFLLDLLERWKTLRREARVGLGTRFLTKVGEDAPEGLPLPDLDQALFRRLSALADRE